MKVGLYGPKPGMGASTLARQLARNAASKGQKVLLVELDYHYPSTAVAWNMVDRERCLEYAVSDYLTKPAWQLKDYLLSWRQGKQGNDNAKRDKRMTRKVKKSSNLHVLVPSGQRGFEHFPEEPEQFMDDLMDQAKQQGFSRVILDMPSEVDSILTLSALRQVDVCVALWDGSEANRQIIQHRLALLRELELPMNLVPVVNLTRPGRQELADQAAFEKKSFVITFPFVRHLSKRSAMLHPSFWQYRQAHKRLLNLLIKLEEQNTVGKAGEGGRLG